MSSRQPSLKRFYHVPRAEIRAALQDLLGLPGIVLPGKRAYRRVFDIWMQQPRLSFADCYHAVLAQRLGSRVIISFDQGFDRLAGIRRREP